MDDNDSYIYIGMQVTLLKKENPVYFYTMYILKVTYKFMTRFKTTLGADGSLIMIIALQSRPDLKDKIFCIIKILS